MAAPIDDGSAREQTLADGGHVVVRPIRPDDADELRRAFEKLSPTSRYHRFLGAIPTLSDATVTYLTHVDGERHVAFVALEVSHDLKSERGVGVARFVRLDDDPSVADAAVTVIDEAQGRGIAHVLLAALIDAARARGVRAFRVEVLASNDAVLGLLAEAHAELWSRDGDVLGFRVPLAHLPRAESDPPRGFFGQVMRAAGEAARALRR